MQSYSRFLFEQVLPSYLGRIYVSGVTLPIVQDAYLDLSLRKYTSKNGVASVAPLEQAWHPHDYDTRRRMVLAYNQCLAQCCGQHDRLVFVDLNPGLVDGQGQVDKQYVDQDPTNIHLLWERTIAHWMDAIPEIRHAPLNHDALEATLASFHSDKKLRMQTNPFTCGLVAH